MLGTHYLCTCLLKIKLVFELYVAVKASNFVWKFTDKFSGGLCLDFVRSLTAS